MYLRRWWNMWTHRGLRHLNPVSFVIAVTILVTLVFFLFYNLGLEPNQNNNACFSEVSLQRASMLDDRVRIIPSRHPRKTSIWEQGKEDDNLLTNPCISIPTPPYSRKDFVMICIHDPEKDLMVSAHLKHHLAWEPENVKALYTAYAENPKLMLVDLGSNLGVFTLPAAHMGMQVLALDAMQSSLHLLQKSLFLNGLSCQVTLIHNALHSRRMKMRVAKDPSNMGASRVVEIMASRRDKVKPKDMIDAICLDDLVPLVKGREVFLKMDLEASENAVLQCAHQFFKEVNVKIMLLEWLYFRNQEEAARSIMDFLFQHGMKPTWGGDPDRQIDIHAAANWPDNVFWVKT